MKKSLLVLALCSVIGSANASVFRTVDSANTIARNASWSFGTIFTVGANSVNVTSLGAFDAYGDGFVSGSIQVGIFDEVSNLLLASANVSSTHNLIGDYRYSYISNLQLTSGNTYRLVAVSDQDLYSYPTSTYDSNFTIDGYGYCIASTLTSCADYTNFDYGMANFQFNAVPVPAAAWLFGSGLIGLIGVARRSSKS